MEFHLGIEGGIEFQQVTGNVEQEKGSSMNKDPGVGKERRVVSSRQEGLGLGRYFTCTVILRSKVGAVLLPLSFYR